MWAGILVYEFGGMYSSMTIADSRILLGMKERLPKYGHCFIAEKRDIPDAEIDNICALVAKLVAEKNANSAFDLENAITLLP